MIGQIVALLKVDEFYNHSKEIEIAKGKYQLPTTFKKGYKKIKRSIKYKK